MNHTQRAIQLAKSAGYQTTIMSYDDGFYPWAETWLDPKFWQFLEKSLDWQPVCRNDGANNLIYWPQTCLVGWFYHQHRFIDALASGQTPDDFFATILPADK